MAEGKLKVPGKKKSGGTVPQLEIREGKPRKKEVALEGLPLSMLCSLVTSYAHAYGDLAEMIEDKAYVECENGKLTQAVDTLYYLAQFLEQLENKTEENSHDLSEIYLLIGQMYQYAGHFEESVNWFTRAIAVDDQQPGPYHCLAVSYQNIGNVEGSIRSLEQEVSVSPGNYYTYLLLADMYSKINNNDKAEESLRRLLERDPENIQGLHHLVKFYESSTPSAELELLIRRILNVDRTFNRMESMIKIYYLCREKRFNEALVFLDNWAKHAPDITMVHLLKAHIFGELHQFTKKKMELVAFKRKNGGRENVIAAKIQEFGALFGEHAVQKISRRMILSSPALHIS